MTAALDRYSTFQSEYPDLFNEREHLVLDLERAHQDTFEAEQGATLGIVHETAFLVTIADLVHDPTTGRRYCYTRIAQPGAMRGGHGVVVIPRLPDGRLVLIEQERHATGRYHIEFPRGVAEAGKTPEQLAAIELSEEIGVTPSTVRTIGSSFPDNGILATRVSFVLATLPSDCQPRANETQIRRVVFFTLAELADAIRHGLIDDGFTVQAMTWLALDRE